MPARVSPTDRVRAKIDELFASDRELPEILEEVARLGAQLLMQAALEAEVTEFLGRDRYQRSATAPDARSGARNGYRPATVKTTAGPITLERPKLRGTTAAFASRLFGKHVSRTNALESLVIASFVRGLSVRDVEATLADALGDQAAISKSTVAQVCQAIKTDGLAPGVVESTDAWANFLTDLTDRGLACPLLVVSDGAAGLIAAIEQIFPTALRQRCLIHRLRNVLAKIPAGMQAEIRDGYWACFDTADLTTEPGPRLVELIDARLGAFATRYAPTYPAAMKIALTDREGLTAYLRFPPEHHHRIRHSNFIERTFGETRRRAKVIGRFPGETSCISIAWAVLDRASRGWRGLTMTPAGLRQLQDLRRSLLHPPRQLRPQHTPDNASSTTETVSATA